MFRYFSLLLFICISLTATAQEGKIYYDEHWQETKKKNADYYRIYTLQDSVYKIEDHYIDGPLYMTGYRTTIENNNCIYRVGPVVFYDKQGHKVREGQYVNSRRAGVWKTYYNGTDDVKTEIYYSGKEDYNPDLTITYDPQTHKPKYKTEYLESGNTRHWDYIGGDSVFSEVSQKLGKDTSIRITKYKDHSITSLEITKGNKPPVTICYDDKKKLTDCETKDAGNKTFVYTEQMPRAGFDLSEYLGKNMHYPRAAREAGVEGRVVVKFVVDEDGAIADVRLIKGIEVSCDEEAKRVVAGMPYWQPGLQNGEAVRVYFTLPITFKVH